MNKQFGKSVGGPVADQLFIPPLQNEEGDAVEATLKGSKNAQSFDNKSGLVQYVA